MKHSRNILTLALTIIFSCGTISADTFKVGVILHLSGDLAMQSRAFQRGIELAAAELQEEGIGGRQIELIFEDGHNQAHISNRAARKLITFDKIQAGIISSYLDAAANGPLFEAAGVPVITLWDANPEIDALGDYIFAIGPWTPGSGEAAAAFSRKKFAAKRAVIVRSQDPFSESVERSFTESFTHAGGEVLKSFVLNVSDRDFRAVIAKIKKLKPDVIYSPVVYNQVPFYRQIRELGIGVPIISCDVITNQHIDAAPGAFEGVYHTMIPSPNSKEFERVSAVHQQTYGQEIKLPWFVAAGYDALHLLAEGARRHGAEPEAIKNALYTISDFPGASAKLSISRAGSSPQFEKVYRITNSRFEPVQDGMG